MLCVRDSVHGGLSIGGSASTISRKVVPCSLSGLAFRIISLVENLILEPFLARYGSAPAFNTCLITVEKVPGDLLGLRFKIKVGLGIQSFVGAL